MTRSLPLTSAILQLWSLSDLKDVAEDLIREGDNRKRRQTLEDSPTSGQASYLSRCGHVWQGETGKTWHLRVVPACQACQASLPPLPAPRSLA